MVIWFNKINPVNDNKVCYQMLLDNMKHISNSESEYVDYLIALFEEYNEFLKTNQTPYLVIENIKKIFADRLYYTTLAKNIGNNFIILSPSHDNTYYVLSEFNKNKEKLVAVFCFDMHCDCYDSIDNLWKGNVFSKLLKENYIDELYVIGVPSQKVEITIKSIDSVIRNKVKLIKDLKEIDFKKLKATNLYISIDMDCLDTRKEKYTALEYCPTTVLSKISKLCINQFIDLNSQIESCIFVKNELGYSNYYKVGENKISLNILKKSIIFLKEMCNEFAIEFGITHDSRNDKILAEITEINGYDYGGKTAVLVNQLVNCLEVMMKGGDVNGNEKSFFS